MNIHCKTQLLRLAVLSSVSIYLTSCDTSSGIQEGGSTSQDPDPVVVDFPITYIERPIPRDEDGEIIPDSVLSPAEFKPGARLIFKDRASVPAAELILTDEVFADPDAPADALPPLYDVKDLAVSHDGLRLLFSMRAPEIEGANDDEQPKWNIWEYDRETLAIRRLIQSDLAAELGHDIDPDYLPDGRIVFSSTRQPRAKAILLDENKPQFDPGTEDDRDDATFVLHTMDDDGTNIRQITYNESHDLAPSVMENGDIVFLRWDNYVGGAPAGGRNGARGHDRISLYTVKPDGSEVSVHYGYHSQNTGTEDSIAAFIDPIQLPNGQLLTALRQRESLVQGGNIIAIDTENFVELNQTVEGSAATGSAQSNTASGVIYTDGSVSPQGYFSSAYPLYDGTSRLLASWSGCFVEGIRLGVYVSIDGQLIDNLGRNVDRGGNVLNAADPAVVPDADEIGTFPCGNNILVLDQIETPPPMYGIWTFDPNDRTQRPVVLATEDTMYTEAVVMGERPLPDFFEPEVITDEKQALIDNNVGVLHIRSVYDLQGVDNTVNGIDAMADPLQTSAPERPARFIRILKAVSLPNEDVYDFDGSAFGRAGGQMKDILGYVPIEPDGSAKFQVPADVSFTFSIVDANGRRATGYLGDRHQNWLTLQAGEVRVCSGCHAQNDPRPHGRLDAEPASAWPGAIGGVAFPNSILLDEFDTPHTPPETGETMAEYYARIEGPREPSVNIEFEDDWTDESITPKAASYDLSYADLPSTASPTTAACQSDWTSLCRILINYIDHIQPVWDVDRRIFDVTDPTLLIEDRTCTSCHNRIDALGAAQVPAGQLELVSDQSADRNDFLTSYAELFFNDIPQVVEGGILVDEREQARDDDGNLLFLTDDMGNLVLDAMGNRIPVLVAVDARGAYLSPAGARNNNNFFNLFVAGGSHEGYLEAAELKLISEWLDIGGQYYNNPFDAPEN